MTENKNEAVAVFRFGVIHEFVGTTNLAKSEKQRIEETERPESGYW